MSKIIKIGVMGCANIAQRSVIPAILQHPQFQLVAVASRTAEKANQFANQFNCKGLVGYENLLLEDLEAVYIPLPTGLHEEWVTKSLEAGKHVFVEKSFGMNFNSTNKMLQIALDKNLVAMENFMFPYHSQHKFLMNLIQSGEIGEIRNFRASFGFPPLPKDNFRYNATLGGGAIMDAAAYTVKVSLEVLGKELEYLSSSILWDKKAKVDTAGSAHLIYNNKVPVQLSWGFDNFYQCGIEIWGSKGKITTNRTYTANIGFQPSIKLEKQGVVIEHTLPADNHFHNILSVLYQNIQENNFQQTAEEVKQQSYFLSQISEKAKIYECE